MIRKNSNSSRQKELPFSSQDDYSYGVRTPPFSREAREDIDGISPHEAFVHVSQLRELPEHGVIKQLADFIGKRREKIKQILNVISIGRSAKNYEQRDHATTTLAVMETLNDLELASYLFELDLTSIQQLLPPGFREFVDIFHKRMGDFRREIAKSVQNSNNC